MTRYIDIPPIWLIGALCIAWVQGRYFDFGLSLDMAWVQLLGGLLVGGGILLIALAAIEFYKHKTTIVPHQIADRLITQGIFKRSRNPIYLGDTLILLGLILKWDSVLSLPLLPIFVWVIEKRFILPEEDRLRRRFRVEFARYLTQTRRWI
jgi:protein-S-isoprenylcysteine O-methyltransferase Ste14